MTWLAVKGFCKKAWKFVVDQWLFFVAGVVGIIGFIIGSRGSNAKEVLEIRAQAEKEERAARQEAQHRTEEVMRILGEKMESLSQDERDAVGELLKNQSEELERQIIENREKPLEDVVGELALKYGLTKILKVD